MYEVKRITWDQIRQYWIDVDHFRDPRKTYVEYVTRLGPYKCSYEGPRQQAYGLFDGDILIGVTQLVQWTPNQIRTRTFNIREPYRGRDLAWKLVNTAIDVDWDRKGYLFAWTRANIYQWALRHGFRTIGRWYGDHIGMTCKL